MKGKIVERPELQWHPAFYAGIRIEFFREAKMMYFENEHQLGTKPKEIDVLIIKKNSEEPIQKNIGRIFRKHNLVEYKSPTDYLGIDDFYKTYAYACFYKMDTEYADEIGVEEITISFVCKSYLRKLIAHLQEVRKFLIQEYEGNQLYHSVMDIIVHANEERFEEVKNMSMCQALRDLFKDELEEGMRIATQQATEYMRLYW